MILKKFQNRFHKELDAIYGGNEVDSFFFLLTEHYLDLNRLSFALKPKLEIHEFDEIKFQDALTKLKKAQPIQYIIGETEFYGLPFKSVPRHQWQSDATKFPFEFCRALHSLG